jgi:ATP-dependent Lhr-like helicase
VRELDIGIEVPPSELAAVCSHEQWGEVYERLKELIGSHRSTLIFVNTRRLAERVAHALRQQLGEDSVAAHHGSLSREIRLDAEERLKSGRLKTIVATASLELGIDIGFIDLVCQIGSPRSIATFLQRVGRAGHSLSRVPKGRLFPLTRDELIESLALLRAVRGRRLDAVEQPTGPLDILAQQIVATVACEEWKEDDLFDLCRRAWPYRQLSRPDFDAVLDMLSEGFVNARRRGAYLHRDRVNGRLRARRGARIAAITSGGAIPETGDYRVITESDRTFVGTVNEDFAIESLAGDVFILGNTSWRITYVRSGEVIVNDAQGAPATIPFWLGEAPARTVELSEELSRLRDDVVTRVREKTTPGDGTAAPSDSTAAGVNLTDAIAWLQEETGASEWPARQAVTYIAAQQAAIGLVPTQKQIVFERFFDESGGMQLVIHAPFGGRINRAWGLALRKRFCRSFDFELQAAANDNGIVLSLGPQHSFPIDQMFQMLRPDNGEHLLTQALLAVPMFGTRWRWNSTRALAVLRMHGGKRVPAYLQRFRADDLLTAAFPAQTACLENRPEDIPIPDHPLVRQTVHDCLREAMDLDRWLAVLREITDGRVRLVARDTFEASPFSHEILNSNPYAFLDDAPLEERRARAVSMRRSFTVESVRDLGKLDPEAIAQVRAEAWPLVRDADELHDAMLLMTAIPASEAVPWSEWFRELVTAGRATIARRQGGADLWVATERWSLLHRAFPDATADPPLPPQFAWSPENGSKQAELSTADAWIALVRGRLECLGPLTASRLAADFATDRAALEAALESLEGEGFALRGRFTDQSYDATEVEWCERRLLARIHRLTLEGLRQQIRPANVADYVRFLLDSQHLAPGTRLEGRRALAEVIEQLQGFEVPAGAWEHELLPARLPDYDPRWLDDLSLGGHVAWGRLAPRRTGEDRPPSRSGMTRVVPIALAFREDMAWLAPSADRPDPMTRLHAGAQAVLEALTARGALFPADLQAITGLLPTQLEDALGELAALGLVTADGFAAIRGIVSRGQSRFSRQRSSGTRRLARWGRLASRAHDSGGRWSLFARPAATATPEERAERWAWQLLRRYGVMFRDLLARESLAPRWRELLPAYRRLEARGEIRGGRFVTGVAGEQFALPSAVEQLRRVRDESAERNGDETKATQALSQTVVGNVNMSDKVVVISACDPINIFGIVTSDARVPATRRNRIAVCNGRMVASFEAGVVRFAGDIEPANAEEIQRMLRQSAMTRAGAEHAAGGRVATRRSSS